MFLRGNHWHFNLVLKDFPRLFMAASNGRRCWVTLLVSYTSRNSFWLICTIKVIYNAMRLSCTIHVEKIIEHFSWSSKAILDQVYLFRSYHKEFKKYFANLFNWIYEGPRNCDRYFLTHSCNCLFLSGFYCSSNFFFSEQTGWWLFMVVS